MSAGSNAAADRRAYFFMSYAHGRGGRATDPLDRLVREFYDNLSAEVARLARLPHGTRTGFADWEIQLGTQWRRQLGQALATCGVFIALYTPDYFERTICGQEWAAFHRREQAHFALTREEKAAIIPVMWKMTPAEDMPPVAQQIHYHLAAAGEMYRRRGMRELVLRAARPEIGSGYRTALKAFAEHILDVAGSNPLLPLDDGPLELDPDEDAFARGWPRNGPRPLRFAVVAPERDTLPRGAVPDRYGTGPDQWRPYWPAHDTPIARTIKELGAANGYQPIVESFADCPDLREGSGPTAPTILVVDPWCTRVPELDEQLRTFDALSHNKPWVRLMVAWDRDGAGARTGELDKALQRSLDRLRNSCKLKNPDAVAGIPTVAEFGRRFQGVVAAAERGYFSTVTTYPPPGPAPRLPRLGAPGPDDRPGQIGDGEGTSDG